MKTIIQFSAAMALLVFCSCKDENTVESESKETGNKTGNKPTDGWCGTPYTPLDQLIFISNVRDVKGIVQRFDKEKELYLLKYPYYLKITSNEEISKSNSKQGLADYMKLIPIDNRFTEDMVGKEFTFNGKAYEFHTMKYENREPPPYVIVTFYFFAVTQ